MVTDLNWPNEFVDPKPVTSFGDALTELLNELVESGCDVTADRHWSWFSISREGRMMDLVRRGRMGGRREVCWEIRLSSDRQPVQLGKIFGIRQYACVVITGMDNLRNATKSWLGGEDIHSLLRNVTFWDRLNPQQPLQAPTTDRAAESR